MKANEAEILVANSSAMIRLDDAVVRIVKGKTTARRGAKIVKGREHLFIPLVIDFEIPGTEPAVEADEQPQTEKRGPGRPRKNPLPEPTPEPEPSPEPPAESSGPLTTSDVPTEGR